MTRHHVFQAVVWAAVMALMVQWHWEEYGEPINPMVAFITGGLAAYYGTGFARLFLLPFRRLYARIAHRGRK